MILSDITLGEALNLFNGKAAKFDENGEYIVFGSNGIIGRSEKANQKPAIILGRVGAYCGSVKFSSSSFWASDNTIVVRPTEGQDLKYWYYKLIGMPLRSYAGGAAQPLITHSILRPIKTQVHTELDDQKRIANVLCTYDELIENNLRRVVLLEEAAKLLYREWFVHFRFPGAEHVEIVDGVPKRWEWKTVGDLGLVVTGKTPPKKVENNYGDEVPFIKTPDMHGNALIVKTTECLSEQGANSQKNKTLPIGSILVSCIGTVGVVSLTSELAQTNQQINAVVPNSNNWRYFSYFALQDLRPRLEAMGGGATMANVNKSKFESVPILFPDESLVDDFFEAVEKSFSQIEKLARINLALTQARNLLFPRLMDGRLEI